jgi:hypothetical protein
MYARKRLKIEAQLELLAMKQNKTKGKKMRKLDARNDTVWGEEANRKDQFDGRA